MVSRRAESAGGERGAAVTPGGVAVVAGAAGGELGARRRAAARGARLEESGAARLRRATVWQAERWGHGAKSVAARRGPSGGAAAAAGASDGERGSAAAACGGATSVVPSGEAATVGGEEERIPAWQRRQWRRGWSRARGGGDGRWPRSAPLAWSEPTAYSTERGKCGKR